MTSLPTIDHDYEEQADLADEHAELGEEHADHRMFGLATFLVADGMTFAGFFVAYLTFRAVNPLLPDAVYELELPLPTLNTVLLLVSSATFHRAGQALKRNQSGQCQRWLFITAGLGLAFLASQMVEYFTLPFGLTDNLYASTFYAVTGFHGLHVTLGTIMILIVWWQARSPGGRVTSENHFPLEAAELYWHFVDGIWVILFIIFYLL
ncbi:MULTISPECIES: cytochrome c oxidase subunit 3 [Prochlorococcus]|jgi:cytochrome c oxidase subunit 3|uniref:cytochrome c oxidase subunit 3 n=1 Tax=Prochlorococcus TaxID=1218 RepID=UPI0007B33898|nr:MULTISPECIES: cytochrome c oxidase subunit 3 [Prochlorococcus]MEC7381991.1 cytochrome c oxidase subunit 3 [Cyanobacteriota bacterium]CAI8263972.1 MAG: Cytochrome c oxidase subunit 3 [Prochlorococcus marinus str. MIT 9313]KZR62763.1 Cytochrome c oxidase subunit 3 [Prochlorococcus marinus str. MIT 1312]KZR76381.1 Cytochrome c oxidase subunit 3 [Prochlorococcus marinus str. MIT 1323]KZR80756.1 Cytochrome c oxidase subunit 3 [Prochlorococcus marinus str. MIT 1327]|tara:strand:- start:37 stop:660 length:624 start_codon:yes stop_codon:yes gene_type:complete